MKVKFLSDYQGRETNGIWISAGMVFEVDDEERHLITSGLAVEVKENELEPEPERLHIVKPVIAQVTKPKRK